MDGILSRSMAAPRVYATLLGAFAALALGLAAVGALRPGVLQRVTPARMK